MRRLFEGGVYSRAASIRGNTVMEKHEKFPLRLLLSTGGFSITQAGFFICCSTIKGLFASRTFIFNFDVPGHDFYLQSFLNFMCLSLC